MGDLIKNDCYAAGLAGARIAPKGVMVHSTAANNPWLRRYVGPDDGFLGPNANGNTWNQPKPDGEYKCVHGFIGKMFDGTVAAYQTLPWDFRGWHAGGRANDNYIGFEICEDDLSSADYFAKVYREAVEFTVYLCKMYGIKPAYPNIICHSEGFKLGVASNHADVMHWFPKFGKSMDAFRAEVAAGIAPAPAPIYRVQTGAFGVRANAEAMLAKMKAAGFADAFIKAE